mgnify:CR=1 FL=1|tara:strand:- start:12 stop:290 length:279 start_codon:yes stop_codon:yes gene_type:complete
MTSYTPKAIAMAKAGIIKLTMWGSERIVSDAEYRAWNEQYRMTLDSQQSYEKRPAQIQYVDANRTQTTPQINYWMLILPVLVLAVVLIEGRA